MADRLTQLQDALDNQMTLMYAAINHIQTRHPYGSIPSQPDQGPAPVADGTPAPEDPETFNAALHELAQKLVLQEKAMEYLIESLPGLGSSEESQTRRMRELEAELREVGEERKKAEAEREELVDALGVLIGGVKRVT